MKENDEGMVQTKVESFKWQGDFINLYSDKKGNDLAIALPKWMFNQIVEAMFDVKVAAADKERKECPHKRVDHNLECLDCDEPVYVE